MADDNFNGKHHNGLFAVFDGHSGDKAAEFCQKNMSRILI
jgi:serine/threonine protein phosphatase PrpC